MTALTFDESEIVRDARRRYWEANGFGDDGGASKTWEIVKFGPLPIPIRGHKDGGILLIGANRWRMRCRPFHSAGIAKKFLPD